jgi:peptide/nickel transport system permease protein
MYVDTVTSTTNAWIETSPSTEWVEPDAPEWPQGNWINVSWLFGPFGLFGDDAHFHGTSHGVLRLDFGTSWSVSRGQPIVKVMQSRLRNTLTLMITSTVLSLIVAIPIGIFSAVKQYSRLDYVVTTFTFFGTAMPVFWLAIMLILIFSVKFRDWGIPYMPAGGVDSVRLAPTGSLLRALNATPGGFADRAIHLILPTVTLSLLYMAQWSRFMRAAMLDVLRQDYVRTARAKGLTERLVIVKHAMRNALIPLVTIVVFTIPGIFSGATITETIFSWQGMGRLYYDALGADDWPVVMVFLFITAILTVIATLTGDILYTIVDPRIRYD